MTESEKNAVASALLLLRPVVDALIAEPTHVTGVDGVSLFNLLRDRRFHHIERAYFHLSQLK